MITEAGSLTSLDLGKYYAILPQSPNWSKREYINHFGAKEIGKSFKYNSGTNDKWESTQNLLEPIKEHVNPTFIV